MKEFLGLGSTFIMMPHLFYHFFSFISFLWNVLLSSFSSAHYHKSHWLWGSPLNSHPYFVKQALTLADHSLVKETDLLLLLLVLFIRALILPLSLSLSVKISYEDVALKLPDSVRKMLPELTKLQCVTKTGIISVINQQHKTSQMQEFSYMKDDPGGYARCSMVYPSIITLWSRKCPFQSGMFNATKVTATHTEMRCKPLVGWTKHFLAF